MKTNDSFRLRQQRAPLYEALIRHAKRRPHSFHVPGHKMGNSFDQQAKSQYQALLSLDVTEISGLDDLHQPEGVIAEAQELAAEAYDAELTRFLIGGTTAGNIALVLTVCKPGDKIIVQRNCHKSVYHGIILAKAQPVFVIPAVDPVTGVAVGLRREDVERTLVEHPDAKAVFLTNPTYYGMGIDIRKLVAVVHRFAIPLLVDEAHGSHYGFHPQLPESAMQCGADAAVQSTHKMSTAMTMSSMLHIQGKFIDRDRLFQCLGMIQSSSPSYPLMASLDLARRYMLFEADRELERLLPRLQEFRERLASLSWLMLPSLHDESIYTTLDPLKLMLCLRTSSFNGDDLLQLLEAEAIFPELHAPDHVLLAASTGTTEDDLEVVWRTLHSLSPKPVAEKQKISQFTGVVASQFLRDSILPMHEAIDLPKQTVPLATSAGEIAGEMVIPYPPGIPLLVPGERIDEHVITILQGLRSRNIRFHGVKDAQLHTIQIVATTTK